MLYAGIFLSLALLLAQVLEFFGLKESESGSFVKAYVSLVSVWSVALLLMSGLPLLSFWLAGRQAAG